MGRTKWWRDPGKETFWRETLEAWRQSGLDIRAFCLRHRLAEHNFYAWRRELARRDQEAAFKHPAARRLATRQTATRQTATRQTATRQATAEPRAERNAAEREAADSPAFVAMHVAAESLGTIDILVPGGIVVRVAAGVDRSGLRDVLAVLAEARAEAQREGRPC